MNEKMQKNYESVGEGLMEVVDNVLSFAQAFDLTAICHCDSCVERNGIEKIKEMEQMRKNKIKRMALDDIKKMWKEIVSEDEDGYYHNWTVSRINEEGNRHIAYGTGGGLEIQIDEIHGSGFQFSIFPPKGYFRANSKLYRALESVGYEFVPDGFGVSETKMITYGEYAECAVCGNNWKYDEYGMDYCPYCGREIS